LQQQSSGKYSQVVQRLLSQRSFKPKAGKDVGDHPPITPQKPADGHLSGDNLRIYEYVVQNFIGSIMGPAKYVTQTLK
jgi:DNA topoisomerase-3